MVREIWRYPVKSVGGESLRTAHIGRTGITGDRAWGVRDETTGMILTGRREPRLLMATARINDDRPVITTADGRRHATVSELSAWLDRDVTMVAAGESPGTFENPLDVDTETNWVMWKGPAGSFHDSARTMVSLVSNTSLGAHEPRRFRINLILDGEGEDDLVDQSVSVGEVRLGIRKQIDRCIMVTRAQPGIPSDMQVLKQVVRERGNLMGIGAVVDAPGRVDIGDPVRLL